MRGRVDSTYHRESEFSCAAFQLVHMHIAFGWVYSQNMECEVAHWTQHKRLYRASIQVLHPLADNGPSATLAANLCNEFCFRRTFKSQPSTNGSDTHTIACSYLADSPQHMPINFIRFLTGSLTTFIRIHTQHPPSISRIAFCQKVPFQQALQNTTIHRKIASP